MANILDPVRNFAIVTLSSGYNDVATSVVLVGGDGAKLPAPSTDGSFNMVWWNATDYANPSDDPNKEIVRVTARSTDTLTITRAQEGTSATTKNTAGKTYKMILAYTKEQRDKFETWALNEHNPDGTHNLVSMDIAPPNLLSNGNFINNSSNGYGGTPDDWTNSNANPVQGGIPALTKQNLIDAIGIANSDIQGLWPCNGLVNTDDIQDLSSNNYPLDCAGHVPAVSLDGLMASALDFESSSSQYGSIADASCANLEIAGSQTWIVFVKPESVVANGCILGKSNGTTYKIVQIDSASGKILFLLTGLTTNTSVFSDVILMAGKWNMIVGVYDSANSKLKIWVNGIKKEVTASGSTTDTNGTFNIGRTGGTDPNYFDGLIQNACVLSVALTDNQVKKLFAETLYKGIKLRRATTNAIAYQDLPMDLVERLRGKTVALRADLYQDTASTAQISILQTLANGSTSETIISATDATTGSWLEKVATGAIDATAVGIRIQLKHSTTDGNTWFKKISLYEGSVLLPYDHSKQDWSNFASLLKMKIPCVQNGYSLSGNILGYAQIVATQSGITSAADIAGLIVNVDVPAGRRIRITGFAGQISSTVTSDRATFSIREASTYFATSYGKAGVSGDGWGGALVQAIISPTAGYHEYKLTVSRDIGSGSVSVVAGSDFPAFILVELI